MKQNNSLSKTPLLAAYVHLKNQPLFIRKKCSKKQRICAKNNNNNITNHFLTYWITVSDKFFKAAAVVRLLITTSKYTKGNTFLK
jgi:hypothetical protein